MPSQCRILTKLSGSVPHVDIMLWCKFEVICMSEIKIIATFVFCGFVLKYIGKSHRIKGIYSRLQWHLAEGWRIWFYGVEV